MTGAESALMEGPTPEQLAAFGAALDAAMRSVPLGPAAVGAHVGVSDDAVRRWIRGETEPPPWRVFATERLLGLAPGELSYHLGFVPVSVVSVFAAIDADEGLSERDRRLLRTAYQGFRSS